MKYNFWKLFCVWNSCSQHCRIVIESNFTIPKPTPAYFKTKHMYCFYEYACTMYIEVKKLGWTISEHFASVPTVSIVKVQYRCITCLLTLDWINCITGKSSFQQFSWKWSYVFFFFFFFNLNRILHLENHSMILMAKLNPQSSLQKWVLSNIIIATILHLINQTTRVPS